MQIDRINGPKIHPINKIKLPHYILFTLSNGIPVYCVNSGSQELIKLDIIFEGGRHIDEYRTQSRAHGTLLKDGTSSMTSEEMSNFMDFYGATFSTKSSMDYTSIHLFSLTRFFETLLPKMADVIFNPIFPQDEIDKFINNSKQKLIMSLAQNDMIAYREFTSLIYGNEHVYGYNTKEDDYDNITKESLYDFHRKMLAFQPCKIFVSGSFDTDKVIAQLESFFGHQFQKNPAPVKFQKPEEPITGKHYYASKNKHQVALRMGRPFGNRSNPDYTKMLFLNNVLGGFFGSRLMSNIREDKGYTYNIFSDLDLLKYDGYFYIQTEMDKIYLDRTLSEITKELERLKREEIPEMEFEMNRNYILGNMLHGVDGPFNAIRLLKSIVLNNRSMEEFEESFTQIAEMKAKEIQQIAQMMFQEEDFTTVIVGDII